MVEQADQSIPTLITIGKAGEGKSTFLNQLTSNKQEVFKTGRSTDSITQDVQIEIINFNNNKLRIIDIPGLLDGRSSLAEWVSLLQQKIANIKIDGVMIVTKSQNIRIDASVLILAACINSFFENFQGDSACITFTHCDQQPIEDSEAQEYMQKLCQQVKIQNIIKDYIPFAKGNPQSLQKLQEFISKRIQARQFQKKAMVVNQKPSFQQVIDVMNDQYGDEVFQSVLQKEIENMKRVLNEKLDENNKIHAEQMKLMQENMNQFKIALDNAKQKEQSQPRRSFLQKIILRLFGI